MIIRRASSKDARAITTIHVQAWKEAYQGIVPQTFLDSLSVDEREVTWRRNLTQPTADTWVAEERGKVHGWASSAPSRDSDAHSFTAELLAIYVDPRHWRRGVGRQLWQVVERQLREAGFSDVTLWVFKDNARALRFYGAIEFAAEPGSERTVTRGSADLPEVRLRKAIAS